MSTLLICGGGVGVGVGEEEGRTPIALEQNTIAMNFLKSNTSLKVVAIELESFDWKMIISNVRSKLSEDMNMLEKICNFNSR